MDKFSDLLPIIIGIIFFIAKIISDANKKQQQNQKKTPAQKPNEGNVRRTWEPAGAPKRNEPVRHQDTEFSYDTESSFDWSGTKERDSEYKGYDTESSFDWNTSKERDTDYRTLDPAYVPKEVPDIDYDKLADVNVADSVLSSSIPAVEPIKKVDSQQLAALKRLLRKKEGLQELVLLSEIMNKPKAYRKWRKSTY